MTDDGFDGGPAAQFALDLGRHPSLLAGDEDPELVIGRRVVAAVSLVGEDACDDVADQRLHVRDHGGQRVTVIGVAGHRLHVGDELAGLGAADRGGNGDFDAELVSRWPCLCRCILPPARAGDRPSARVDAAARGRATPAAAALQMPLRARCCLDRAADVADHVAEIGPQRLELPVGAFELLGVGIVLMLDQGELAHPRIGLA